MNLASYKIKPNDLTVKERHRVQPGRIGHVHAYFIRQSAADLMTTGGLDQGANNYYKLNSGHSSL